MNAREIYMNEQEKNLKRLAQMRKMKAWVCYLATGLTSLVFGIHRIRIDCALKGKLSLKNNVLWFDLSLFVLYRLWSLFDWLEMDILKKNDCILKKHESQRIKKENKKHEIRWKDVKRDNGLRSFNNMLFVSSVKAVNRRIAWISISLLTLAWAWAWMVTLNEGVVCFFCEGSEQAHQVWGPLAQLTHDHWW